MKRLNLVILGGILLSGLFVACTTSEDFSMVNESYFSSITSVEKSSSASDEAVVATDSYLAADSTQKVRSVEKVEASVRLKWPIITIISPEISVVDFGDGFILPSGKVIKGQVYISQILYNANEIGKRYDFKNLSINNNPIKGYRIVTGVPGVLRTLRIVVSDTTTLANGINVIRNSNRTRTCIDSYKNWTYNSYSFSGISSGVNSNNVAYQIEIIKPMISLNGYKYYVSGTIKTTTNKGTQLVDFGNGEKDSLATSTINNVTKDIILKW